MRYQFIMDSDIFALYTPWDLQDALREFLLERRKILKKSRRSLAEQSGIPAPTIRRFEETGEISLRQFCVLWCTLSDDIAFISFINSLRTSKTMPKTMNEVLENDG